MLDGTHSLSWLAPVVDFFGFSAPFFGAISQICFGIGGGSACESRSARAEEEDEMAKWQRWEHGVRRRSYKALPPPLAFKGFWETAPQFVPLRILHDCVVGHYLGFRTTAARIAHLSPQFINTR